jgi:hypothetical protein
MEVRELDLGEYFWALTGREVDGGVFKLPAEAVAE